MQKDFHFEATYYAARIAGFEEEEALPIAWAAQYIDDAISTETTLVKLPSGETYPFTNILTANTIPWGSGLGTLRDDKHRQIWALYHFPPGNYLAYGSTKRDEHILRPFRGVKVPEPGQAYSDPELNTTGEVSPLENDKLTREHFPMICRPYSDLVLAMLENTSQTYNMLVEAGQMNTALHFLGVRMHVFADTWAHQDHIGAPDRRFNQVESFKWYRGEGEWDGVDFTPGGELKKDDPGGSQNFALHKRGHNGWLGHGPMGSWPDLPWAVYEWQPRYNKGQDPFVKNNPREYIRAFANLVHAMHCFRDGIAWSPKCSEQDIQEVLGDWIDVFKNAILEMQAHTKLVGTYGFRQEARMVDEERAAIWINNFNDLGRPSYDKDLAKKEFDDLVEDLEWGGEYELPLNEFLPMAYFGFHYGAKIHYRFMRNELRSQGFRVIFNNLARKEGMVDDFAVFRAAQMDAGSRAKGSERLLNRARALIEAALADCTRATDKDDIQLGVQLFGEDLRVSIADPEKAAKNKMGMLLARLDGIIKLEEKKKSTYNLFKVGKIKKRVKKLRDDLFPLFEQVFKMETALSAAPREDLQFHTRARSNAMIGGRPSGDR